MERKKGVEIKKVDEDIKIFEDEKVFASDVDWNQQEIPVAFPSNGLSEGASLVRLKNGKIAVLQRDSRGMHYGASVLTEEMVKVFKKFLNKS